ncbi:unnamed protein product [Closterium sp. Yama58-4]|nr:unnamed protein product [Closterium sp. Yama58-4]
MKFSFLTSMLLFMNLSRFTSDISAAVLSIQSPKALNKKGVGSDFLAVPLVKRNLRGSRTVTAAAVKATASAATPGEVNLRGVSEEAMEKQGILVYGATGTTGTLIAQKVKEVGLPATLAGRNLKKLEAIGKAVGLPVAAVDLNDTQGLVELVGRHKVVLHVAGPFTVTSKPMIEACISTGTHYLDVTGEFKVMENARTYDATAKEKGIMILPAVGFDVIPGDCLAGYLKDKLPSATDLHLATFISTTAPGEDPLSKPPSALPSHGTLISGAKHILTLGGLVRRNGAIVKESVAKSGRSFLIRRELPPLSTMSFPAAELFSTSLSTSIPNITVYVPGKSSWVTSLFISIIQFAARVWPFNRLLESAIRMLPTPDTTPGHRVNTGMACAGEVVDTASNKRHRASVIVGEGYHFTASCSVEVARRVLQGEFKPGYQTPATAYGTSLVQEIPGERVEIVDLD